MLKNLEQALSHSLSYKAHRTYINERTDKGIPTIPYSGVVQSDATFVKEGNFDTGKNPSVISLTGRLIGELTHLQELAQKNLNLLQQTTTVASDMQKATKARTEATTRAKQENNPKLDPDEVDYDLSLKLIPRG